MMAYISTATHIVALSVAHRSEFRDATIEALRAELAKTRLDLERSRMTGEDLRSLMTGDDEEAAPEGLQVDVATSPALYEGIEEVN